PTITSANGSAAMLSCCRSGSDGSLGCRLGREHPLLIETRQRSVNNARRHLPRQDGGNMKKTKSFCELGAVLIGICIFALGSFAQVGGRLLGTVIDTSGAAVPNAMVSLTLPGGGRPVLSATADAQGLFTFSSVRPESYDLAVEAPGFQKQVLR